MNKRPIVTTRWTMRVVALYAVLVLFSAVGLLGVMTAAHANNGQPDVAQSKKFIPKDDPSPTDTPTPIPTDTPTPPPPTPTPTTRPRPTPTPTPIPPHPTPTTPPHPTPTTAVQPTPTATTQVSPTPSMTATTTVVAGGGGSTGTPGGGPTPGAVPPGSGGGQHQDTGMFSWVAPLFGFVVFLGLSVAAVLVGFEWQRRKGGQIGLASIKASMRAVYTPWMSSKDIALEKAVFSGQPTEMAPTPAISPASPGNSGMVPFAVPTPTPVAQDRPKAHHPPSSDLNPLSVDFTQALAASVEKQSGERSLRTASQPLMPALASNTGSDLSLEAIMKQAQQGLFAIPDRKE